MHDSLRFNKCQSTLMPDLIFATHNQGKILEMREILFGLSFAVKKAEEAGIVEDVEEDGKTFEENAFKKAQFVFARTGKWTIADDSGIMIDALGGAPGVLTARWAGEGASGDDLVYHTLSQLKDVPEGKRQATFVSVVVLISPTGQSWTFEGIVRGRIPFQPVGSARPKLPYDTIFIPETDSRTFGEMSDQEKNAMSHRGLAFQKLKQFFLNSSTTELDREGIDP